MRQAVAALLIALVCSSCAGDEAPDLRQPSGPVGVEHPGLLPSKTWEEVLQDLPFELTLLSREVVAPGHVPATLKGIGNITAEELAAAFQKAGIQAQPDQFRVEGPTEMPVPADTYPVAFKVLTPTSAKSGSQLEAVVRVTNLSSADVELNYGVPSFLPVLVDKTGAPVRWTGGPWPMPLMILRVPAKEFRDIKLVLPLNRFNPRLPLAAGEYTLKVAVRDVDVIVGSRKKVSTTVTSPVIKVTK